MLAYEIHVAGADAEADASAVRAALERACGEPLDPPVPLPAAPTVQALVLPPGLEWSFERLREVVGSLHAVAGRSAVSLRGLPEDDGELLEALERQAGLAAHHGHVARASALRREAGRLRATLDGAGG